MGHGRDTGDMASIQTVLKRAPRTALKNQTYKLGELFAGAGGMALGASQAKLGSNRFHHVWVNDNERDACRTFAHNFGDEDCKVLCHDVRELDFDELPDIDGLVFGFPCNDFSVVGDRHGIDGKFGGLYRQGIRALEEQQPLFFVAENVSGLTSSGNAFETILNDLEYVGYDISYQTYRFEEYGVPQARRRIIIVGFRNDLGITDYKHPDPTTKDKPKTSRQALRGIARNAPNNERTKQSPTVIERLEHIKPGENAFTAKMPKRLRLDMKSGATISQVYRRLKPDTPAYTVTGSGGGGTHIYHWSANRALTNRERARLQSFPDEFVFLGGKESVRKQIGMAVPPEAARVIFNSVLKTLKDYGVASEC